MRPSLRAAIAGVLLSFQAAAQQPVAPADLKFAEMFRLPVGPRGLEPSARLLALDGQRVRIVGYMVHREKATPGAFLIAPLPVLLGDEDEGLADDLPASSILVQLAPRAEGAPIAPPYAGGLFRVTGVLRVGNREEPDGRVSAARIDLASTERHVP
ncbi:hypothetical protein BWI17_07170 [Betaproteobacteria bacterium GR16-43]|nr:hypothetical protein BWI17_07170 [Betaproteobacteria bacterium GR16-43]